MLRVARRFAIGVLGLFGLAGGSAAGVASAHVKYVTPGSDPVDVVQFLVEALTDPFTVAVLVSGGTALVAAMALYLRFRPLRTDITVLRAALEEYRDLVPWLLRLSVGLPLVGAGFNGYFFSPIVVPENGLFVRLFGITIGFLLLFGLATRLVAAVGLVAYLAGAIIEPALVLALEYLPGFLAILLLGGGRPSADQVIAELAGDERTVYSRIDPFYRRVAVPFVERIRKYQPLAPTIIRAGLGASFVYLGTAQKLMNPGAAVSVVTKYNLTAVIPVSPELWVIGAGLAEVAVGVALFAGLFTRAFASLSLALFTLTLFGLPDDPVLAHVSLFGLASVLIITGSGPAAVDAHLQGEYVRMGREIFSSG